MLLVEQVRPQQSNIVWNMLDVINQCSMNNQFFSLKLLSILPENETFDIQVYINDTILCCHWTEKIPNDKTFTCVLKYECLNFLFFFHESSLFRVDINENELSYYPIACNTIVISHPVYEYIEGDEDYETLFKTEILCPNQTLIDDDNEDELHRVVHTSIMTSSSIFTLASNILASLLII